MVVVITGSSAGVGRATAIRFAKAGARLALIARSRSGLEAAKRDVELAGGEAAIFPLDVSDSRALFAAADEVAQRWRRINVWINNAMATMFAPLSEMTCEEYKRITEVTYFGYVYGTMAALKHMRVRNAGTIVQVGSALSYRAIPLQSAYCGAKFAVRAFTDALRSELRHERSPLRLTMVQLPAVNTPQFDWARNRMPRRPQPLPPVFEPDDIAEIIHRTAAKAPREVWIGYPTLKVIAGSIAAPGYLDRYLAGEGYAGQMAAEPEIGNRAGNLFAPVEGRHAVRGRFNGIGRKPMAFDPRLLRAAVVSGALLAVVIALAV